MKLLTRLLLARFAWTALRFVLALTWLALLFVIPRTATRAGLAADLDTLQVILAKSLPFLEAGLLVGAPLAVALVLVSLRQDAILPVVLAAPRGAAALRRSLFCFAVIVLVVATGAFEANHRLSGGAEGKADLWRRGGTIAWLPPHRPDAMGSLLLFRPGDLEVSRLPVAGWTPGEEMDRGGSAGGSLPPVIAGKGFRPIEGSGTLLDLPPPSAWDRSTSLRVMLVALNRVLSPVLLVLLSGYLALLLPPIRQWLVWPLLMLLVPLVVSGGLWFSLALWRGPTGAIALESGWLLLQAGTLYLLDQRLSG